jgi:hypothetical protein
MRRIYKETTLQDRNIDDAAEQIGPFFYDLEGEVVAVIPNNNKTSLSQIYGGGTKVDFLLIFERIGYPKK